MQQHHPAHTPGRAGSEASSSAAIQLRLGRTPAAASALRHATQWWPSNKGNDARAYAGVSSASFEHFRVSRVVLMRHSAVLSPGRVSRVVLMGHSAALLPGRVSARCTTLPDVGHGESPCWRLPYDGPDTH